MIHLSDPAEGSGYSFTHDQGIVGMQKSLGLDDSQIIRKNKVDDQEATAIETAIRECIEEGSNIIFATSWGYMDTCNAFAMGAYSVNPDVEVYVKVDCAGDCLG